MSLYNCEYRLVFVSTDASGFLPVSRSCRIFESLFPHNNAEKILVGSIARHAFLAQIFDLKCAEQFADIRFIKEAFEAAVLIQIEMMLDFFALPCPVVDIVDRIDTNEQISARLLRMWRI